MDVSDISYFFLLGEGEGGARGTGGGRGIGFFVENPRKGGGVLQEGEGLRGREGVCSELGNWGGGGLNIFFGPKCPPSQGKFRGFENGLADRGGWHKELPPMP